MPQRNIVNLVNFIRTLEPRHPFYKLFLATKRQVELMEEYRLPTTFLFEYDALLDSRYTDLLRDAMKRSDYPETGLWLEVLQPMTEAAGIPWRGTKNSIWDWSANVGFLIGYKPEERLRLIDAAFKKFKEVFGEYPSCVGTWVIDSLSLQYIADTYHPKAFCICRDQWGTDGYNIWGGYYNGAYYPSKNNMLSPAQSVDAQIRLPVFRMLGSDPIYQYEAGMNKRFDPKEIQTVITLEAGNKAGGGNQRWVDWYLKEIFSPGNFPFGYTQAGQENAFGWRMIRKGYELQCRVFASERDKGTIEVEHLSQTGAWFEKRFPMTPPSVYKAASDWKNKGRASYWYSCADYRANVYLDNREVWIRDITLFDENSKERYLTEPCRSNNCYYENLPVVDGYRWSGRSIRAGMRLLFKGRPLNFRSVEQLDGEDALRLHFTSDEGDFLLVFDQQGIHTQFPQMGGAWKMQYCQTCETEIAVQREGIHYRHNGSRYGFKIAGGSLTPAEQGFILNAEKEHVELSFLLDEASDEKGVIVFPAECPPVDNVGNALPACSG